jgi:hypothetical protein
MGILPMSITGVSPVKVGPADSIGRRRLVDGSLMSRHTIGKLRRLRLPLPPVQGLRANRFTT